MLEPKTDTRKWRLPAEWEPQWGVQLTWPHAHTDWAPILDEITATYQEIAREIAKREHLLIVAPEGEDLSPLTPHLSPLTSHFSPLTSHLSPLTSYILFMSTYPCITA